MSDNRDRIWFSLFVLTIFCSGAGAGFLVDHILMTPPPDRGPFGGDGREGYARDGGPGRRGGPPPFARGGLAGPPGLPPPVAAQLADELRLDEAQRTQLRKVLDDHRAKYERVHRDARDRFEMEQHELWTAIRAFLRPDQVEEFDRFMGFRR